MIWWQWIIFAGLTAICATLYRMGGAAGYSKAWRRFGCPVIILLGCFAVGIRAAWWQWLLAYGLQYGSLTTYFEVDKNDDTNWYEWILTGAITALAIFPLMFGSGLWLPMVYRIIVLSAFTTIWSEAISNAVLEELGRGVLLVGTLLIFLIGG